MNLDFSKKEILTDFDDKSLPVEVNLENSERRAGEDHYHSGIDFLEYLQNFISVRRKEMPKGSYTTKLFESGINKIAQKVGEEAVELVIEAKDQNDELFLNEAADLMYHFIVLLIARGYNLNDVANVLKTRHK